MYGNDFFQQNKLSKCSGPEPYMVQGNVTLFLWCTGGRLDSGLLGKPLSEGYAQAAVFSGVRTTEKLGLGEALFDIDIHRKKSVSERVGGTGRLAWACQRIR